MKEDSGRVERVLADNVQRRVVELEVRLPHESHRHEHALVARLRGELDAGHGSHDDDGLVLVHSHDLLVSFDGVTPFDQMPRS